MLGYWLICNGIIAIILTYLWIWVVPMGASQHEALYGNLAVQISSGSCYLFKILLIFLVWRERRIFSGETEITDEYVRRWTTHDSETGKKAAMGYRCQFYSRTTAKDTCHENNLELNP